jgi:hypothetical protein
VYDLRDTHASLLAKAGVPIEVRGTGKPVELLRHADFSKRRPLAPES